MAHHNTLDWVSCRNPLRTTKSIGSTTNITQLLFSYHRIVTADDAGNILVFSPDGELHYSLKGHRSAVWCIASTKTKLISGSEDKTIRVWNLNTGRCTHVFRGHTGPIPSLQIVMPERPLDPDPDLPDDRQPQFQPIRPLLISVSTDHTIKVWIVPRTSESEYGRHYKDGPPPNPDPVANPYYLHHLTGHTGPIRCVVGNRTTLLTGGDDCIVRAWNLKRQELLYRLQGHTRAITQVTIDPRLRMFYSASLDGHIRLWDMNTGVCRAICTQHTAAVTFMYNTPWRIFSAGEDGLCITWNSSSGQMSHKLWSGDGNHICDIRGDDYKVLTCTEKSAKMWTPQDGNMVRTLYHCRGQEKLSHVAYEFKQCALTHKDARGVNTLTIIDFRPPEELDQWLGPSSQLQDADDEAHP